MPGSGEQGTGDMALRGPQDLFFIRPHFEEQKTADFPNTQKQTHRGG